jgi:hypothetical protein
MPRETDAFYVIRALKLNDLRRIARWHRVPNHLTLLKPELILAVRSLMSRNNCTVFLLLIADTGINKRNRNLRVYQ